MCELGYQWMRGYLPGSVKDLSALSRGKVSERIVGKFPVGQDGHRRNPLLETIRGDQVERMLANRFKQTVSARKRWHPGEPLPPHLVSLEACRNHATASENECHGIAEAIPQECPPPTTHQY